MKHVGCAGIVVKDTFCGPMAALPQPGELVSVSAMRVMAGGCAGNVALDLVRQGIPVDLAGCVGRDSAASALVQTLEGGGVDCRHLTRTPDHPTSETVILLVEGEDRRYIHSFGANRTFRIADLARDWIAGLSVFYLGGLFALPGVRTDELLALLKYCRAHDVVTVVDVVVPTGFQETETVRELLPQIDWFLPNETEAAIFTGEREPIRAMARLREWGASNLVITRGDAGALAASGEQLWQCDAYQWTTVDPSGAGDAFASGVITGIQSGWELPQTLRYASAVGASATRAIGTTTSVFTFAEAQAQIAKEPVAVHLTSQPNGANHGI